MILVKTPYRISFMGGRTDFPSFYQQEEGAVVATTINKYVYITLAPTFEKKFFLNYSEKEVCSGVEEIRHPLFKNLLKNSLLEKNGLEISIQSEIPAGTGLGSSSSFTVGLLNGLATLEKKPFRDPVELAEAACRFELETLRNFTGKQDQYSAAMGGLNFYRFLPSGKVEVEPLNIRPKDAKRLESSLLIFYTGIARNGSQLLEREKAGFGDTRESLRAMKNLAHDFKNEAEGAARLKEFGQILHEGWQMKRGLNPEISSTKIDEIYERARKAGAYGGKLLGAGGGGFVMFLVEPDQKTKIKNALSELEVLSISFVKRGSRVIQEED